MDLCKHAYYSDKKEYFPLLYCKLRGEGGRCIYSKKCLKVEKFVPLENEMWRECAEYIMDKVKNIPNGSYFVQANRPNKQGKLYLYVLVEDNKIERILSNFTELEQDYVYLRKLSNDKYEISLTPFEKETKDVEKMVEKEENNIEKTVIKEDVPVKKEYNTIKKSNTRGRKKKETLE